MEEDSVVVQQGDLPSTSQSHENPANFSTLAKIVDHMKKRYFDNPSLVLSFDEILEEIQSFDLSKKNKLWLLESLPNNPRIQVDNDGKFKFKPPYKVKGKTSLIKLLKKRHENCDGGVLLSDLAECIPQSETLLENLGDEVIIIETKMNGKRDRVLFWNDPGTDFVDNGKKILVNEEFKADWRSISSEEMTTYLAQHGVEQTSLSSNPAAPSRKEDKAKKRKGKEHNEHMKDTLEDYNER